MTSSLGRCSSRATIFRASANGQAFDCSAARGKDVAGSGIARDTMNPALQNQTWNSKRADWKIAQPQVGKLALLPQSEQRPVECLPQQIVTAANRDADALTDRTASAMGPAAEFAAASGVGPVQPKGERDAVAEQKVNLAFLQRVTRRFLIGIRMQLGLSKQRPQIGLMRGTGHHRNLAALRCLGAGVVEVEVAPRHKTRRRAVIGIAEIYVLAHLRRLGDRGDHRVAVVAVQGPY